MRIIDLLINSVESQPDRYAIKSNNIEVTYAELLLYTNHLAKKLKYAGCSRGVKVAIVLGNSVEYMVSFFAISAADGIILPLSTRMRPYEIAGCINQADVSIVITHRAYGKRLLSVLSNENRITLFYVQYNAHKNLDVVLDTVQDPYIDKANKNIALFVQTSGTTGSPKIVMLTDSGLISNMTTYRSLMNFEDYNIVYCALSLHHIYCICAQILTHISLADTFILYEGPFLIKDFLRVVELYGVTITAFVPYMAILFQEYPHSEEFNLSSLKYVTLSGAKTPKLTYEKLSNKFKTIRFINTYGMSEAGSRISISAPFPTRFPVESVGRPIPGVKVRVMDETGKDVGVNVPGEILIKSSGIMKGYYKQPDLTAKTIMDGWLKTGDIGKIDEHGNLFILGRLKDIIIMGGENLCPAEIEEYLIEHPAIREAVVVGQKHKLLQEVPFAFIVKTNSSEKLTPINIVEYCKKRLSNNKIPKSAKFLETLPRLETNKIDRNALKNIADSLC